MTRSSRTKKKTISKNLYSSHLNSTNKHSNFSFSTSLNKIVFQQLALKTPGGLGGVLIFPPPEHHRWGTRHSHLLPVSQQLLSHLQKRKEKLLSTIQWSTENSQMVQFMLIYCNMVQTSDLWQSYSQGAELLLQHQKPLGNLEHARG